MKLITLDFETYYDKDYSLSKMPTWQYVRDSRFEAIMLGIKVDAAPTQVYVGDAQIRHALGSIDWDDAIVAAHNAYFDCSILGWHYGIHPHLIACTLSIARSLGQTFRAGGAALGTLSDYCRSLGVSIPEKGNEVQQSLGKKLCDFSPHELAEYARYCATDVDICHEMLRYQLECGFPFEELESLTNTIRMGTRPLLRLNGEVLRDHLDSVEKRRSSLIEASGLSLQELRSNDKLAAWLVSKGVTPPMKVSKTTDKDTYAFAKTDEAFTALLEDDDPEVVAVVEARLGVKTSIEQTRTQRFLDVARTGPMPVPSAYYAAHTGRIGGTDKINLANLTRGGALRKAIEAPPGGVIVVSDSSQIEARLAAYLGKQWDMVEAFRQKKDVYALKAADIFGYLVTADDNPDERFVGKVAVLSGNYGTGAETFRNMVRIQSKGKRILSEKEAKQIIHAYRDSIPSITQLWAYLDRVLSAIATGEPRVVVSSSQESPIAYTGHDCIFLPNGMKLQYPNLRQEGEYKKRWVYDQREGRRVIKCGIWGGALLENLCQALARIIIQSHWNVVAKTYPVVQHVYDELGVLTFEDDAESCAQFLKGVMSQPPSWATDLPIECKVSYGKSYGEAK